MSRGRPAPVSRGYEVPSPAWCVQLWTGNPARKLRALSVDEIAFLGTSATEAAKVRLLTGRRWVWMSWCLL